MVLLLFILENLFLNDMLIIVLICDSLKLSKLKNDPIFPTVKKNFKLRKYRLILLLIPKQHI